MDILSIREASPSRRLEVGHYLALGDRSGNPGNCCNVIFCRSLVAGTEAYESAPYLSAPNLGVSVANESLWIICTVLQKYQSTKTCMKSNRDLTLHSQASRVSQERILVPNQNRYFLSHSSLKDWLAYSVPEQILPQVSLWVFQHS